MAVSQDYLNSLDELIMMTEEPCTCASHPPCRKCKATEEVENIGYTIQSALEQIKSLS